MVGVVVVSYHSPERTARFVSEELPKLPWSYRAGVVDVAATAETATPAAQPEGAAAPLCPKCGVPMVLRHRKSDGGKFWGCSNFPKCRSIENIIE